MNLRDKILNYIIENPGAHLRKIQKDLVISMGQLEYHLRILERKESIVVKFTDKKKRYFATYRFSDIERKILTMLRKNVALDLVLYLFQNPYSTVPEISKNLHYSKTWLCNNLKKLISSEIVTKTIDNKYRVTDESQLIRLFLIYEKSFNNKKVSEFLYFWLEKIKELHKAV